MRRMLAGMEGVVVLAFVVLLALLAPRFGTDSRRQEDRGWHFGGPLT